MDWRVANKFDGEVDVVVFGVDEGEVFGVVVMDVSVEVNSVEPVWRFCVVGPVLVAVVVGYLGPVSVVEFVLVAFVDVGKVVGLHDGKGGFRLVDVVVVAVEEDEASVELLGVVDGAFASRHGYVPTMEDRIFVADAFVPRLFYFGIHLARRGKRAIAVFDDVTVVEVGVGDEEEAH